MKIQLLVIAVLFAAVLLVAVRQIAQTWFQRIGMVLLAVAIYAGYAFFLVRGSGGNAVVIHGPVYTSRPVVALSHGYVGSESCRECHTREHATWHESWHRTMTQVASPESVLGSFDDQRFELDGNLYVLKRRGEDFLVEMGGPDAKRMDCKIVLLTGSHLHQLYWYSQGKGRKVGLMPYKWLIEEKRWVPFASSFVLPPDSPHLREEGKWNQACIKCHATLGKPKLRRDGTADTEVVEFGISCEACHGPGEAHVLASAGNFENLEPGDYKITNPAHLSHERSTEVCGQCHSLTGFHVSKDMRRWNENGFSFRPGQELAESRVVIRKDPEILETELLKRVLAKVPDYLDRTFWSDGTARLAGREYLGLLESPCYQRGEMSCLSCHQMHQAEEDPRPPKEWANHQMQFGMQENQGCLQCHQDLATDIEAHTHHAADSSGSQCYNCHMPHTSWGLLKAVRAHQVDSPSVQAELASGRPNACNQCHLDKSLRWTSLNLNVWYEQDMPKLSEDETEIAASLLWLYSGDAGQRALAAWSMGWPEAQAASGTEWMAPHLSQLLNDPYDAVRFVSHRSLRRTPGFESFEYDFLNPPQGETFAPVVDSIRQQWIGRDAHQADRPMVLIDRKGVLDLEKMNQLLEKRDDRVVELAE